MKWVKLHTTLHHHIAFRRLTAGARLVFYVALEIAGDLDQDGALAVRGVGPMTIPEIALEVGIKPDQAKTGLAALIGIGFMSKRADGAYVIEKWDEKAGEDSSTARVREWREKQKRNVSRNGNKPRSGNRAEVDTPPNGGEEEEVDSVPSGTAAPCLCLSDPFAGRSDLTAEQLVEPILDVFTGAKKIAARNQVRPMWAGLVRKMLADKYTPSQIWGAFAVVHADSGHGPVPTETKPFWMALDVLRPRRRGLEVVPGGKAPRTMLA